MTSSLASRGVDCGRHIVDDNSHMSKVSVAAIPDLIVR